MSPRAYDRLRAMLSAIGLAVSAYLTLRHHDSSIPLVCSDGSFVNCASVLASPSSVVFGVPVAVWGLLWFAVEATLAVLSLRRRHDATAVPLRVAGVGWALVGAATVLWLVYQEIGIVGKLCAWCTAVHVIVLALLVVEVQQADRAAR